MDYKKSGVKFHILANGKALLGGTKTYEQAVEMRKRFYGQGNYKNIVIKEVK